MGSEEKWILWFGDDFGGISEDARNLVGERAEFEHVRKGRAPSAARILYFNGSSRRMQYACVLVQGFAQCIVGGHFGGLSRARCGARAVMLASRSVRLRRREDGDAASFAGQLETFLYIRSEEDLLQSVCSCWSSLHSERVSEYSKSIAGTDASSQTCAVVVQLMVAKARAQLALCLLQILSQRIEMKSL